MRYLTRIGIVFTPVRHKQMTPKPSGLVFTLSLHCWNLPGQILPKIFWEQMHSIFLGLVKGCRVVICIFTPLLVLQMPKSSSSLPSHSYLNWWQSYRCHLSIQAQNCTKLLRDLLLQTPCWKSLKMQWRHHPKQISLAKVISRRAGNFNWKLNAPS